MDEILKNLKTANKNIKEKELTYDELRKLEDWVSELRSIIVSKQMQFGQYYEDM